MENFKDEDFDLKIMFIMFTGLSQLFPKNITVPDNSETT